jgi:peptidoglycan/xylan/chitin deacetylase (PgdA/CDA1 family)
MSVVTNRVLVAGIWRAVRGGRVMERKSVCVVVVLTCLLMALAAVPARAQGAGPRGDARREVAITFDDLPGVAMPQSQRCDSKAFAEMNRKLLRSVAAHRVPALGLVVEGRLCEGQRAALPDILGLWLDAGLDLGNHSFSHFDLNNTPLALYQADVVRGETVTSRLLQQRGKRLKYFRHPLLHAGNNLETKRAFEKFLVERGYSVAPVTIDNQEWVFAEVYAMAKERGDKATAERVAGAYVAYMEEIFDFFEKLSVEVVGYEIRQVLLLHANPLNADYFDELVRMMKGRGYAFVSLDRALEDSAYSLPDAYAGPRGLSWLHRWALTKGMEMREEPREPEFIAKLYRDYADNPAGRGRMAPTKSRRRS